MVFKKINLSNSVIVFDLDDTLYKEADYQNSGLREVAKCIKKNYKIDIDQQFVVNCIKQKKYVLNELCKKYNLNQSIVDSLVWTYRLHKPKIYLKKNVKIGLNRLEKWSAGVAILTDGRAITQRLKLQALGIDYLPSYISEDYSDTKISPKRFKKIMKDMPAKNYVYIGDNPSKDFYAPNKLKWLTIGIKGNSQNIHPQKFKNKSHSPLIWLNKFTDLFELIRYNH
tara:strand:- start:2722 stop:3399 length:678 start_codon:yes stop_codon:yes gene_type:complete